MYYLAIDIGASSGRHILGSIENGKIQLNEIHRFENKLCEKNGHLCWDTESLFSEIIKGLKKCKEEGKNPKSLGIDCFGVDFVLLDKNNRILGDTVAYRDLRTKGIEREVFKYISEDELYEKTGIVKQIFNTIYQLFALNKENEEVLNKAERFLMLPEYFNYLLTGKDVNEYTNATTTQMVNAKAKEFDGEIIKSLGLPQKIFGKLEFPGYRIGRLKPEIEAEIGFNLDVILPPTHDTGSAIVAVPTTEDCIYISSGTWSLMGTLRDKPDCSKMSKEYGFTNEGGYDGKVRYLKNIMGLWIIQSIRRELNNKYSFPELSQMAQNSDYDYKIDVNDNEFFSPKSMIESIKTHLKGKGYPVPKDISDILRAVYHGLAENYANTVSDLEKITGKSFSSIYIIGGGSRDNYLNNLTAEYTKKTVYAGPVEATAIGNILTQMIEDKVFKDLNEAKKAIIDSFDIENVTD